MEFEFNAQRLKFRLKCQNRCLKKKKNYLPLPIFPLPSVFTDMFYQPLQGIYALTTQLTSRLALL